MITDNGDNIYVNITIEDPDQSKRIPAEYRVTKTIPILPKSDDYYASVIKFTIPLDEIPLLVMPIVPNQPNPDLTPFVIGISTGGVDYPFNVIYNCENGLTPPVQNQPKQVVTEYYFVFEFENLLQAINAALAQAFSSSSLSGNVPYFYIDVESGLINLVVDVVNFATYPATPPATIFINSSLQSYLNSFHYQYVGPSSIGKSYQFVLSRTGNNNRIPPFDPAGTQKRFIQEYTTLPLWSSLRNILLTSSSMPISSEFTSSGNSGETTTFPIISEFTPQIERSGDSRSVAYYIPSAQYRLIDLNSSTGLNTIDVKIYWQDKNSNIYPLYISRFQQANIKLGFFKKSIYKGYWPQQ